MPAPTFTYQYDYTTARDRIRLLISDTNDSDRLLYDQEIARFVSADGDAQDEAADYQSAAKAAGLIALKFARQVQSISAGGSSVVFDVAQGRAKFYRDLAETLAKGPNGAASSVPFAGGISALDRATREANPDRVKPFFQRPRYGVRSERLGDWP